MSDQEIKPEVKSDPLYQMLRHEDVDSFNNSRDTLDTSATIFASPDVTRYG
jgi:hypothetical protein